MIIDRFVLFYETVPDFVNKRQPFRQAHLEKIKARFQEKSLLQGGALVEPDDMAMMIFASEEAATSFATNDPYVQNGLVKKWFVRKWKTVDPSKLLSLD